MAEHMCKYGQTVRTMGGSQISVCWECGVKENKPVSFTERQSLVHLRMAGWQIDENTLVSPLQIPDGHHLIEERIWQKQQAQLRRYKTCYEGALGTAVGLFIMLITSVVLNMNCILNHHQPVMTPLSVGDNGVGETSMSRAKELIGGGGGGGRILLESQPGSLVTY